MGLSGDWCDETEDARRIPGLSARPIGLPAAESFPPVPLCPQHAPGPAHAPPLRASGVRRLCSGPPRAQPSTRARRRVRGCTCTEPAPVLARGPAPSSALLLSAPATGPLRAIAIITLPQKCVQCLMWTRPRFQQRKGVSTSRPLG